nr:tripartite motif-containing protein 6 isoform X2 [Oryctolagus cuniculus]
MTSAVLVDIQEEVTCPICLELLTEPLSIDCGHSFCQACIAEDREESVINQEWESCCPVCQTSYQPGSLRPNRHLASIVGRVRDVVLGPGKELKVTLCAHHGEKLQLFCKDDGKLICWLCERSQEHRGHHTFLMEEVAQEYQEMFQESLKKLRKEQQEAEKLKAVLKEKRASWKNQMEPERQRIQTEFNQLRRILDKEEQRELKKLEEEERKGLSVIAEAEGQLVQQSQSLRELILDLERRCQGSTVDLLQDVSDVTKRADRCPELLGRQMRFVGSTLSGPSCLEEQYDCSVLGSQHFSSGKYYWEVDVTKKTAWILGVCSHSVEPASSFHPAMSQHHTYSRYQPQNGYWVIGLQHKREYRAYEDSSPSLLLSITVPPRRIGVFLDYEAGTVSFYNVTNHGFPIYTFSKYYFPTNVCPYFNPCNCVVPMTLRRPNS